MTDTQLEEITRGLTLGRFSQAFRSGASAYQKNSDVDQGIDIFWDKYCARRKVSTRSPIGNAWMDGWINADSSVEEFIRSKRLELDEDES